jgi:acyl dehydratase
MPAIDGIDALRTLVGQELGAGEWLPVTQERIDAFAETTGDRQWIHVDPERAARETPFGSTIAHGFLTLSLVSTLLRDVVFVSGVRMSINYGLNRVRFVSPVPSGSRIRADYMDGGAAGQGCGRTKRIISSDRKGASACRETSCISTLNRLTVS